MTILRYKRPSCVVSHLIIDVQAVGHGDRLSASPNGLDLKIQSLEGEKKALTAICALEKGNREMVAQFWIGSLQTTCTFRGWYIYYASHNGRASIRDSLLLTLDEPILVTVRISTECIDRWPNNRNRPDVAPQCTILRKLRKARRRMGACTTIYLQAL